MRIAAVVAVALLCAAPAWAAPFDHDHAAWQAVLDAHARGGLVDYERLRADPAALDAYLEQIAVVERGEYSSWTPDQRLAFWLNAYNAFTLKAIVDHYPLRRLWWRPRAYAYPANSIKQIRRFGLQTFTAAGEPLSLDEARTLLERQTDDARLPFAITCACQGGPPLPLQAFTAQRLEAQLEDASRAFISDPKRAFADGSRRTLFLSPVFASVRDRIGDPAAFIQRYLPAPRARALQETPWRVDWLSHDWSLDELGAREAGGKRREQAQPSAALFR